MIDLTNRPCPVCGQTSSTVLHKTTYREHGYPGIFALHRCNSCGLLFNSPRLDGAELSNLYGQNYYFFLRDDQREFDRIVAMHQRTIAMLPSPPASRRSIDIGSGRGYFPAVLKRLGWEASGIEISPDAARYARSRFGLDVFTGTIEQYAASPDRRQFPLVTAIDVIEHVPSPEDFVRSACEIVEPGGWLIIDTPNARAGNIATQGVDWKGFNPFHIYLFSIENLKTLLDRHGMTTERSFSYGNRALGRSARDRLIHVLRSVGLLRPTVQAYFAMKKLTLSQGGDVSRFIESAAARINAEPAYDKTPDAGATLAGSNAGDNIVVIARKS